MTDLMERALALLGDVRRAFLTRTALSSTAPARTPHLASKLCLLPLQDVTCNAGHVFCFGCGTEPHRPATCEDAQNWMRVGGGSDTGARVGTRCRMLHA
jgi:hypothetical protein